MLVIAGIAFLIEILCSLSTLRTEGSTAGDAFTGLESSLYVVLFKFQTELKCNLTVLSVISAAITGGASQS